MPGRSVTTTLAAFAAALVVGALQPALAQETKPNILVIWGDDIGLTNISYNNRGLSVVRVFGTFERVI